MKGEQIVQVHCGTCKSIFQGVQKAQWMWMGFIGPCTRIKDLEGVGKMKSKWKWNPTELVLRLKRLELRVGFHGLFQLKTIESNRRGLFEAPQSTNLHLFHVSKWERKKIHKSANVIKNREALFSFWPSRLSLFNSLLYVSMHEWREGWEGRKID